MSKFVIEIMLAVLCAFGLVSLNPRSEFQSRENDIGELAPYEGDWIIGGDRRNLQVVTRRQSNMVETFASKYMENFGCPGTSYYSMEMTFDPDAKTYQARLKMSSSGSALDHFREPWLPHKFVGTWDGEANRMTWTSEAEVDHKIKRLEITTHFLSESKQKFAVIDPSGGQRLVYEAAILEKLR